MSAVAVILAAGEGRRLRPITEHSPKCLVPVDGRPLLDYWIAALARAGVRRALINTHYLRDKVASYIESVNESSSGIVLEEAFEPKLLGSAGTLAANAGFADNAETVVVVYADNLSEIDIRAFLEFHCSHDDPFTMALFHAPNPSQCGIATVDSQNLITRFVEKPTTPDSDLANAGVYALDATAYREIAGMKAFDLAFDVLPRFVGRMRGWVIEGYHRDIGTLEALEDAQQVAPAVWSKLEGGAA